ncbi:type I restriction-modification system subunit S [Streptococcus suis]|uniref:restriction endonuclease subunit S n=2 Tax=Streptococcus suis TaxID=1307 RepID=UPI000769492F|nr:restriction endonuclease subunit S [Streptococcus suis]MCK3878904.1 restriction endonuclease subunit S [Streptococcus suis]CYV28304.1 type I restriction-modification system subunit S [Streptococcus suis]HEM4299022.1 restriction endonuclease subunit S [Streptococcus suis]HEM4434433.1 restriction endonuclease subunit S [Streptococcus suis]HEM4602662.1 restriction endonuclease subunit S [Streptococcus suis]
MTPEQLKASILQRAMEGKLVPQDPNDEPASELLKRIKDEKEKLISEGKVKRDKKETEFFCGDDGKPYEKLADGTVKKVEVPYEIPESWEWVRLGNIGYWGSGATPSKSNLKYYEPQAVPWLLTGDLTDGYITHIPNKISELALEKTSVRLNPTGSVLIAMYGATIGKLGILTFPATTNQACCACNTLFHVEKLFLFYFLMSARKNSTARAEGGAQPNISKEKIINTLFPLPPLAEQKRIVTQIERALKQVEIYAENYHKLQELDRAFPDKLKKSILQYAMQGKLVAQNPNDEPVEILLEKIRAEKQKLFEEGKLKKKDLTEMVVIKGDDNSHYGKIPESWSHIAIKEIFTITTGLSYKKTDLSITQNGVRIIRGGNIKPLSFKLLDNDYYIEPKHIISGTVYLKRNQLVTPVSTSLEHIGKFARIDKDYHDTVAGGFVFQLTPFIASDTLSNYLLFNLSSPLFYKQLKAITKLSGQALYNIPKTKLNELYIPLAPEPEQRRIIQKVEKLFEKVNQF